MGIKLDWSMYRVQRVPNIKIVPITIYFRILSSFDLLCFSMQWLNEEVHGEYGNCISQLCYYINWFVRYLKVHHVRLPRITPWDHGWGKKWSYRIVNLPFNLILNQSSYSTFSTTYLNIIYTRKGLSGSSIPIYRWRQCAMDNFGGNFIFIKGFAKL